MRRAAVLCCGALLTAAGAPPAPASTLPRPVRIARNDAAHSRHLRAAQVRVVSYRRVTFSDGCLGLGGADEICSDAMVPGYRAIFLVRGKRVVYRTDLRGHFRVEH
jgi:hypothetical protein